MARKKAKRNDTGDAGIRENFLFFHFGDGLTPRGGKAGVDEPAQKRSWKHQPSQDLKSIEDSRSHKDQPGPLPGTH